jgi:pyridoxamine 5'-phosphate oxidase family protein
MFDEAERTYLEAGGPERLARLGTVDSAGQPTVDAVGFSYAAGRFVIGTAGGDVTTTRKGRNIRDGQTKVSLIVDDLESTEPWRPRGIRVHGEARVAELGGQFGRGIYLVVCPTLTWSWGLEGSVFELGTKRTEWTGHSARQR